MNKASNPCWRVSLARLCFLLQSISISFSAATVYFDKRPIQILQNILRNLTPAFSGQVDGVAGNLVRLQALVRSACILVSLGRVMSAGCDASVVELT